MARVKIYPKTLESTTQSELVKFTKWQLCKFALFSVIGTSRALYYKDNRYYIYKVDKDKTEYYAEAEEE